MDQTTWLQGKRSLVKSKAVNNEAEISVNGNAEKKLSYRKEEALEETVKNLHEQVACLLCECNVKDRLIAEHKSGRERAEALAAIQKQELENILKIEHDRKLVLEVARKRLESKYIEAKKKLANLTVENARLTKTLVKKDETIEDINNQITKATAKFTTLASRISSTERGNNLKLKNRHADMANKQQLETERQKLRLLVRKRAPGHPKTNPRSHSKAGDRRTSLMIKRLNEVEEENQILKAELAQMRSVERDNGGLGMTLMDDRFETLQLTNFDLDNQLFVAKVQLKEAFHKISFLEMEMEEKNHYCEGLEAKCVELQLQLTSVSNTDVVVLEDLEQEEKPLDMGIKMTSELTNNKLISHSSLHDLMLSEGGVEWEVVLNPPMIREIINAAETDESRVVAPRALLPVLPFKKRERRTELLRRVLLRGKRGGNRKVCGFNAYKV